MLIETVQLSTYYAKNILAFFIFLCYSFFEVNFMENASVIAIVNALKELSAPYNTKRTTSCCSLYACPPNVQMNG